MTTNSIFFNSSKEIANKYIQNILFVDDEIFSSNESNNSLDSGALISIFSKAKKLCALNQPQSQEDLENIIELAKKADITVLDWKIHVEQKSNESTNEEDDEEEDDPRGVFTLKLIQGIMNEQPNCLKLIMVYTGETDLEAIIDKIKKTLEHNGFKDIEQLTKNTLSNSSINIIVRGKPYLASTLRHVSNLQEWIVEYKDLPDFLLTEFTKMTEGLISNVVLNAITSVRDNSSKLLNIYNKKMDAAFLAHRALLPEMDEASELLKESISTSIRAIFDYEEIESVCNFKQIHDWIDDKISEEQELDIGNNKPINIGKKQLKTWQKDGFEKMYQEAFSEKYPSNQLPENKIEKYIRNSMVDNTSCYFSPIPMDDIDELFSILTHHKSNYMVPSYIPTLSLGSVLKEEKSDKYWLCIQQRCDCVRIKDDEERRFLFLPLKEVKKTEKFTFIGIENNILIRLSLDDKTYNVRTIKFKSTQNGKVISSKIPGKYIFTPVYSPEHSSYDPKIDGNFIWIMDIKDSHAQRIANDFAAKLARVGLDESEWLRLKSKDSKDR